jgi:hypothetical protein
MTAVVITEATSTLSVVPRCESVTTTTVPTVPAAGSIPLGALGLGLAGLGAMFGFRRRG